LERTCKWRRGYIPSCCLKCRKVGLGKSSNIRNSANCSPANFERVNCSPQHYRRKALALHILIYTHPYYLERVTFGPGHDCTDNLAVDGQTKRSSRQWD